MPRHPRLIPTAAIVLSLVQLWSIDLVAQQAGSPPAIRKSQKASITQQIADTRVAIIYSRPVARGRQLFGQGGVVPFGKEWCPGADKATTFEITRDITVNGQPLTAGKYSLWAIPDATEWTWIFSQAAEVFHTPYPKGQDALRLKVVPGTGSHMETMAYYFPVVEADSAVLNFHWGTTVVQLRVKASKE